MAIFMFFGLKDAEQCLRNPFKYGVDKIVNEDTGDIHCNCYFENPKYSSFYFTKEEIGVMEDVSFIDYNLS